MNRPSLFSFHILGIVIISFLGLIPNIACAEQWLEAPHLQEKVKPLLDASTQAYCQSKGLKTCDFVLGINVAATRKFRSLELLADEDYRLQLNAVVEGSVFQQGYGCVSLLLEGTQSNRQTTLVLPLVLQKQVMAWQVNEALPFGGALVGKVQRVSRTVSLRDLSQLILNDLPPSTIARTNLSKGQLITKFHVKTPPTVLMNQTVKLVVEVHQSTRPIRLVLDAQAMQNGGIGDMIKVKQSGYNHKIYLGQVQTDGTVFVKM